MLPKKTAICEQYRKCGKAGCKCNAGSMHGPYYYYFYRADGKLKKSYIRKADAANLWTNYSVQRQVQKQRAADRRKYAQLSKDLRRIRSLLSEPFFMEDIGD
jgi:hypothetical protein